MVEGGMHVFGLQEEAIVPQENPRFLGLNMQTLNKKGPS